MNAEMPDRSKAARKARKDAAETTLAVIAAHPNVRKTYKFRTNTAHYRLYLQTGQMVDIWLGTEKWTEVAAVAIGGDGVPSLMKQLTAWGYL